MSYTLSTVHSSSDRVLPEYDAALSVLQIHNHMPH